MSPDGKTALSADENGTVKYWSVTTGKEIVRLIKFPDGEWVAITPEGYYNASANGERHLNVRVGNTVHPIDNFIKTFNRQDLVQQALAGADTGVLNPTATVNTTPQSLGVSARNLTVVETQKAGLSEQTGILITSIDPGSLAEQIGMKSGDYLLEFNGKKVNDVGSLKQLLNSGSIIQELKIWRDGQVMVLNGVNKL